MRKKYLAPKVEVMEVLFERDTLLVGSGNESNLHRDTTYSGMDEDEFWN